MGIFKERLTREGYTTTRERANIYAGVTLGLLAPIIATRYLIFQNYRNDSIGEALSWGLSVVTNVVATPLFNGVPLFVSMALGAMLGGNSAEHLRTKRKKELEQIVSV